MLYHINLGLLYGIKELTCDPLFTLTNLYGGQTKPYRIGLADSTGITPLGETWRDTVYPRMSGLPGKTLKKLKPWQQSHNYLADIQNPLNLQYITKIYPYPEKNSTENRM